MQERIIEIIVYILGEFQQITKVGKYKDYSKELVSCGYTESEINLAFSWVFNHLQSDKNDEDGFTYEPDSDRVLHDLEKHVIAPEAYGYLLQLWHLGVLKEYELEDVIEKTLSSGSSHISLEDIKTVAASLIFSQESQFGQNGFLFNNGTNTIH
jgi:uncharacterized protein Smg (DUF494 family)